VDHRPRSAREHAIQSVTYSDGTHAYFEYDAWGRMTRQTRDGGAQPINYTYNQFGVVTAADAAGRTWRASPNDSFQLAQVQDALG